MEWKEWNGMEGMEWNGIRTFDQSVDPGTTIRSRELGGRYHMNRRHRGGAVST